MVIQVNIYNIIDSRILNALGLGIHHSAVQIGSDEYEYSDYGISKVKPLSAVGVIFSHSVVISNMYFDEKRIDHAIRLLKQEFDGDNYNLLSRNCNHFTNAFIQILTGHCPLPYLNRLATTITQPKCLKHNIDFINCLNKTKIKWFPILDTVQFIKKYAKVGDDVLQIGIRNAYKLQRLDACYTIQQTIFGYKVRLGSHVIAHIWMFGTSPTNEFMTGYSGPHNTFILDRLIKNEWIRTQYLKRVFKYEYGGVKIPMLINVGDYCQNLAYNSGWNDIFRAIITWRISVKN